MKRQLQRQVVKVSRLPYSTADIVTGKLVVQDHSVLCLERVLPAGQAFRWKIVGKNSESLPIWRGVIGKSVYELTQDEKEITVKTCCDNSSDPVETLKSYFNLHVDYATLLSQWKNKDKIFKEETIEMNGARVLSTEPVECLFSFICSSNNNIPRISKMVNGLAEMFGEKLATIEGVDYFSFPEPEDLVGKEVEQRLRLSGFGYRAKFIAQTAEKLKELGGKQWLSELRNPSTPYATAFEKLQELPGVGRKVSDCVCLIGLSKFEAVPIDTHVFQVASKLYQVPCLLKQIDKGKGGKSKQKPSSLTPSMYADIANYFRDLWGPYAGWAQQILFTHRVLDRKKMN